MSDKGIRMTAKLEILKHIARGLAVLLLFGAILFLMYSRLLSGREAREFSGVVAEKWISISETDQGSKLFPTILVKTDGGEQIRLHVDSETYRQLQISTRVRHDSNGVHISKLILQVGNDKR
jgi:hypothetical protein